MFRLNPVEWVHHDGPAPHDSRWIGNRVDISLPPEAGPTVAAHALARALSGTPLASRPLVHLEPWPSADMVRKVREHPFPKVQRLLLRQDRAIWRATMEQRLVGVVEALG